MKKITLMMLFCLIGILGHTQNSINDLLANNQIKEAFQIARNNFQTNSNEQTLAEYLQLMSIQNIENDEFLAELTKSKTLCASPIPYYMMYWNDAFAIKAGGLTKVQLKELEEILKSDQFNGAIKNKAYHKIGNHYFSINKLDKKNEYFAKVGNIIDWSIVGVFENISASGFDKDYEPIKKFKSSDVFQNKKGKNVYWFDMNKKTVGSWSSMQYHLNTNNAIVFAQTFITSEQDQEAQIRFGNTGSFKLWVNDGLVAEQSDETDTGVDTYISNIKLKKGVNRILFQLGASEFSSIELFTRITDKEGKNISNIESAAFASDYIKNQSAQKNLKYGDYQKIFIEAYEANPDDILKLHAASKIYRKNYQLKEQRDLLEAANKKYPSSSLINVALLNLYSRLEYWGLYTGKLEDIKKKDPEGTLTAIALYADAMEREDYDEARQYLMSIRANSGVTPYILMKEINLELKLENNTEAITLINNAYSKYPNNYDFVNLKYLVETNVNKSPSNGQKVLKKFLKKNYRSKALEDLANHYFKNGNYYAGVDIYKQIKQNHPDTYKPIESLAKIYFSSQQYSLAINYYRELIEQAPFIGTFYEDLGDCYNEINDFEEAEKNYKKAVEYSPTSFEAREKIRQLNGKTAIKDKFDNPDLYKIAEEKVSKEDYPEDNSVILHEEKQVVLYEGGGKEEVFHTVISVMNNAGIDFWKEYYIGVSNSQDLILEKAEIIKPNGDISKAETNYNQIVFTGLEENDKIILSYRLKSYYDGSLSEHFWDKQFFEYFVPLNKGKYSIIYHKSFDLRYEGVNMDISPDEKIIDDYVYLSWTAENVPSIKDEDYMPRLTDEGATLHLSTLPSWDYIIDWYDGLSRTKAKSDFEVKRIINELFEGKENLSETEKAKIIYDYIVHNIRYSSVSFRQSGWIPQKASKVINTKVGDCKDVSTLFVVMCEEVGIDANLVLIDTKDNGRKKMMLPSIEFNHCIARVELDNEEYYVELTSDLIPFGAVTGTLKNAFGLNINPDDKKPPFQVPTKNETTTASYRKSVVKLNKNDILVQTHNTKTGGYAAGMRSTYKDLGEEARFKEMSTSLNFDYSTIKINKLEFDSTISTNSDSVSYFYEFTVNSPYTNIGDLKIFRIPLISKIDPFEFLALEDRKFDIELWKYIDIDLISESIEFEIPNDKKIVELPSDFTSNSKFGSYELTFKQEGNKVFVNRNFQIKTDLVKIEDYSDFRKFMNEIFEKENINIGLKNK